MESLEQQKARQGTRTQTRVAFLLPLSKAVLPCSTSVLLPWGQTNWGQKVQVEEWHISVWPAQMKPDQPIALPFSHTGRSRLRSRASILIGSQKEEDRDQEGPWDPCG